MHDDTARSLPTAANGMIFVGSTDGKLYAVDPESGTAKGRFATEGHPDNARQLPPESMRTPRVLRPVQ
jgi:outer membrane protein assembly factor BamB